MRVLLLVLDRGGTLVFATSGAMVAVRHRLDVFGVLVLSFAACHAGGTTRYMAIRHDRHLPLARSAQAASDRPHHDEKR